MMHEHWCLRGLHKILIGNSKPEAEAPLNLRLKCHLWFLNMWIISKVTSSTTRAAVCVTKQEIDDQKASHWSCGDHYTTRFGTIIVVKMYLIRLYTYIIIWWLTNFLKRV